MIYRDLQGTRMPALGFGTWQLRGDQGRTMVSQALGMGYRHIDTARAYENEREIGQGIRDAGVARGDIFLTTKVWQDNLAPKDLKASLEASLRDLGTDYVDLLLIHWPNPDIPLKDSLGAMAELQKQGKLRHFGVSNFPVAHMREAVEKLGQPIACNQVEYHPFLDQQPVLDFARQHNIVVTAYSPLARGRVDETPTIKEIAQRYDRTPGQITLRWLVAQDNVCAIPKTSRVERARQNLNVFDFQLSQEDFDAISGLLGHDRLINPGWAPAWDT